LATSEWPGLIRPRSESLWKGNGGKPLKHWDENHLIKVRAWFLNKLAHSNMKLQFSIYMMLLMLGALFAGYSSGHFEGERTMISHFEYFVRDLVHSPDLDAYLQQHGQQKLAAELKEYGSESPNSYANAYRSCLYQISAGIVFFAIGLVGLMTLLRRQNKNHAA
jgi:hypothetical protein